MDKIGFGDAMDSPLLFEPFFRAPSWSLWRAVVRAAFAEPMTADQSRNSAPWPSATRLQRRSVS